MVITPQTEIRLLKCPLEADNHHQIKFNNITAQYNYFNGLTSLSVDNCTYARENGVLRIPVDYDTAIQYNYVMYQNEAYTNKWFYAYITGYTYMNNDMTAINIKTDTYQTWQFDITWKRSFIEREHVADDTFGVNTYPENNFELGDYVSNDDWDVAELRNQKIVVGSTADYTDLNLSVNGVYQNIPTGCAYYAFSLDSYGIDAARTFLQDLTNVTKESAITSMFLAPEILCSSTDTGNVKRISNSYTPAMLSFQVRTDVLTMNGYTPVNRKLRCYPYSYVLVTNGAGGSCILKPEMWDQSPHMYRIYAALTPGCSIIGVPMDYAGHAIAWQEALPLGKYPQLNYSTDQFTNWQTQNGLNNTMQQIGGVVNAVSGAANLATTLTAVGVGGIGEGTGRDLSIGGGQYVGGMLQIVDAMQQKHLAELVPAQFKGNTNCGDIWASTKKTNFTFSFMSIKQEYAKKIDDFFTYYGYQVNRFGIPLQNSRQYWNYIKTIEANIEGDDVPQIALNEIKNIFNNGVTLWHGGAHIYDYSLNNAIV